MKNKRTHGLSPDTLAGGWPPEMQAAASGFLFRPQTAVGMSRPPSAAGSELPRITRWPREANKPIHKICRHVEKQSRQQKTHNAIGTSLPPSLPPPQNMTRGCARDTILPHPCTHRITRKYQGKYARAGIGVGESFACPAGKARLPEQMPNGESALTLFRPKKAASGQGACHCLSCNATRK